MTNEDVIDLYDRAGVGTVVVVLEPNTAIRRSIRAWPCRAVAATRRHNKAQSRVRSEAPVSPALFRWLLAGAGFSAASVPAESDFAASGFAGRLVSIGFGGNLARRRVLRPLGRQQGRHLRSGSHTFHWQIR